MLVSKYKIGQLVKYTCSESKQSFITEIVSITFSKNMTAYNLLNNQMCIDSDITCSYSPDIVKAKRARKKKVVAAPHSDVIDAV